MRLTTGWLMTVLLLGGCDDRRFDVGQVAGAGGTPLEPGGASGAGGSSGSTGGAAGKAGAGGGTAGSGGSGGAPPPVAACPPSAPMVPVWPLAISTVQAADRLSALLWDTRAGTALIDRAASLKTNADVKALAREMLKDTRSYAGFDALSRRWLGLEQAATFAGAPEAQGQLTAELRASMVLETGRFFRDLLYSGDGTLGTLLTASYTFADEGLAKLYDLPPVPPAQWIRVELDRTRRSGILTQASFLFLKPRTSARGRWVRDVLLCQRLPPPPAGLDPPLERSAGSTYRQALEKRVASEASCSACHSISDPPGFAFEHYDPLGRWQDQDNGAAVDAHGKVDNLSGTLNIPAGPELSFDGARGLAEQLVASCAVQRCVSQSFLEYALGGELRASDEASKDDVASAFAASGNDMRELLVAIAGSRSFLAP
jgi:hypothetical protein